MGRPRNNSGFCRRKHALTEDNIYVLTCCRTCTIERALKSQAKKKKSGAVDAASN